MQPTPGPLPDRVEFGPWTGYVSAVPRHLLPRDKISGSSTNALLNPFDGSWYIREGSQIFGDTLTGSNETNGLIEHSMSSKVQQMLHFDSPVLSDGMPGVSALVTKDTNAGYLGGTGVDAGFFGTCYVRDQPNTVNYSLFQEFGNSGTAYYPSYGATGGGTMTSFNMKAVPIWYESGDGGYTRGSFKFSRRFFCAGSRRMLDASTWRYFPNLRAMPIRWNRRFNYATTGLTQQNRIFPTGPWAPLFPPTVAVGTAGTSSNDSVWQTGDALYYSVMFQFEDGSYSMPFLPRPKDATLTSGLGLVVVDQANIGGTLHYYRDLQLTKIPLGPEGTVARIILRTPKQNLTATTTVLTVAYGDLQIAGVLRNNTQTSFTDSLPDAGLVADDNIVRFDWVLPRRARYIGTGDQRAIVGYTLPNPGAIMLTCTGSAASRDLNLADESIVPGSTAFLVRVTATQLQLHKIAGAPGAGSSTNITLSGTSLQSLVDQINATTTGSTGGEWAAQLAPGVDGSLDSSYLCATTLDVTNCTTTINTTGVTTSSSFASVAVGTYVHGTGIAAGTYVVSKTSNTALTLSANATASGVVTLTFASNVGDDANVNDGTYGYMRAYGPALPVVLCLKNSAMAGYDRPEKSSVYFTVSSPGAATTGVSLAANAWASANKRTAPGYIGTLMGITDIEGAATCEYTRGRRLFINQRGVTSGEDFDYRLLTINDHRGCISDQSCVSANNCAIVLTKQGLVATDKSRREVIISNDIHNPTTGIGDLLVEINKCLNGAAADDQTGRFAAAVMGSQLHICYRTSGAVANPTRRLVYDFSQGVDAGGLDSLVNPKTGDAYGWSAPCTKGYSAMVEISRDAGPVRYAWSDTNAGTGDGRIDLIDYAGSAGQDNGLSISLIVYMASVAAPPYKRIQAIRGYFMHSATTASSVVVYSSLDRGTSVSATLTAGGVDIYDTEITEYAQGARKRSPIYECRYSNTAEGVTLYQHVAEIELADAYQ